MVIPAVLPAQAFKSEIPCWEFLLMLNLGPQYGASPTGDKKLNVGRCPEPYRALRRVSASA